MIADAEPALTPGLAALLADPTCSVLRPRFEGCNICTWIGFKHVNYLVEEAVLEHFRAVGLPPGGLFEHYGLGLDISRIDSRILHALHLDDTVEAKVSPQGTGDAPTLTFRVTLSVPRGEATLKAVTAWVGVSLRPDNYIEADIEPAPALAPYTVPSGGQRPGGGGVYGRGTGQAAGRGSSTDPVLAQLTSDANAFGWKWRIPYIYCHFSERLQMSGYLRQMEEVVDLFLADRGISIKSLLDARRWIPVVPHCRVSILADALMEEDLYTIYTVEQVLKNLTYTSRMDCYVLRDGAMVHTATGTITHGYAVIENRREWRLVAFDDQVMAALSGAGSGAADAPAKEVGTDGRLPADREQRAR